MPSTHPILFSPEMIEAQTAGRKRETRRTTGLATLNYEPDHFQHMGQYVDKNRLYLTFYNLQTGHAEVVKCPYGMPGSLLWVRETFRFLDFLGPEEQHYVFKGTENGQEWAANMENFSWKPSIHMPKKAARFWFLVQEIAIERLQDITNASAFAEGVDFAKNERVYQFKDYQLNAFTCASARDSFQTLINYLHAKGKSGPANIWAQNPWVWVIKYKELSRHGLPADFTGPLESGPSHYVEI